MTTVKVNLKVDLEEMKGVNLEIEFHQSSYKKI